MSEIPRKDPEPDVVVGYHRSHHYGRKRILADESNPESASIADGVLHLLYEATSRKSNLMYLLVRMNLSNDKLMAEVLNIHMESVQAGGEPKYDDYLGKPDGQATATQRRRLENLGIRTTVQTNAPRDELAFMHATRLVGALLGTYQRLMADYPETTDRAAAAEFLLSEIHRFGAVRYDSKLAKDWIFVPDLVYATVTTKNTREDVKVLPIEITKWAQIPGRFYRRGLTYTRDEEAKFAEWEEVSNLSQKLTVLTVDNDNQAATAESWPKNPEFYLQ